MNSHASLRTVFSLFPVTPHATGLLPLFIIHFAFFIGAPLALPAQSTLRQQNETALAAAATPLEKAIALDKLGRFPEALAHLRAAAQHAPDDPAIQLHTAIALDHNGDHAAARQIYDALFARIQTIWQNYLKTRKAGEPPPKPTADDSRLFSITDTLNENAALNHVYLGQHGKALAMFTSIYETGLAKGPDEKTNHAALWRVWLTAKMRADDGLRSKVALDTLIDTLNVTTPYHKAMLQLYQGKLPWIKLPAAIAETPTDALTKERYTTESHFFAAGYYRHVLRDTDSALKLLAPQDALPYNGLAERLFIRDELKTLNRTQTR